jgi:hypothetical protein
MNATRNIANMSTTKCTDLPMLCSLPVVTAGQSDKVSTKEVTSMLEMLSSACRYKEAFSKEVSMQYSFHLED